MIETQALVRRGLLMMTREISEQARQSLPVPQSEGGALVVVFFYCPTALEPGIGLHLGVPDHLARFDPVSGDRLSLERVTAGHFGRGDPPGAVLGAVSLPPGVDADQFRAWQSRLYQLLDRLLPAFAADPDQPDPAMRNEAREFMPLFEALREQPLDPYYAWVGKTFFTWVRRSAK